MTETMTRRQRVLAALDRKQPDRVPALGRTDMPAVKWSGHTILDCFRDEDVYVRAQLMSMEEWGVEVAWGGGVAGIPFERALGQKIIESETNAVSPAEPLINSLADLEALPAHPNVKDSRWYRYMASINAKLRKAIGDDACVITSVPSPFRCACLLRGPDNVYVDMYENPDLVKRLIDYCVRPVTELAEMVADAGADAVFAAAPVASRNMISRQHYLEFVHDMHKTVFADWKTRVGVRVVHHTCGDWSDRLDLVAEEAPTCIQIADEPTSKMPLDQTKALVDNRVSIMGNLKCTGPMMFGTPEDVEQECIESIRKGALGGGFLLSSDCGLAWDTPIENIKAILRATKKYGVYPQLTNAGPQPAAAL